MDKSIRNLLSVIVVVLLLYVMHSLASILLPLVIAIMIVMLYQPVFHFMHKKKIPIKLITPILAVGSLGIVYFLIQIIVDSSQAIYADRVALGESLYNRILSTMAYFDSILPIDLDVTLLESWIVDLKSDDFLSTFVLSGISGLSSFGSSFFMFTLYFLILLFSMPGYDKFIAYIAGSDKQFLIQSKQIQKSIVSYMSVKFIVSLVTGLISLIICLIFGVNYAPFWAFLTFFLNFIPTIGSIIATILPFLMAVIQFDSTFHILLFVILLLGIQMLIGNFIEPKIMGNRLRLNTVTIIFGLVFWSFIWKIPGAFLSVPLLVILKIFLQNNESFIFISRLMGKPDK